jgi:ribonuclease HI
MHLAHCDAGNQGLGIFLRSGGGKEITRHIRLTPSHRKWSSLDRELLAILKTMLLLSEYNWQEARILNDNKTAVELVLNNQRARGRGPRGTIVSKCQELLNRNRGWELEWIPRAQNGIADSLAKKHKWGCA